MLGEVGVSDGSKATRVNATYRPSTLKAPGTADSCINTVTGRRLRWGRLMCLAVERNTMGVVRTCIEGYAAVGMCRDDETI